MIKSSVCKLRKKVQSLYRTINSKKLKKWCNACQLKLMKQKSYKSKNNTYKNLKSLKQAYNNLNKF